MGVSRRVRQDFRSILPDKIDLADGGVLRFNARRDTICLVDLDHQSIRTINDGASYFTATASIRNLGIEVHTVDFMGDYPAPGANEKNYFGEFLHKFCNLKTLGLITVPLPGDPDTVEFVEAVGRDEDDGRHDEEHVGDIELEPLEVASWAGDLLRGEDGLRDWYCNVLSGAIWDYVKESEPTHLAEMLDWREKLVESGLSNSAKPQGDLDVRVLAHFREGARPPVF